MRTVKELEYLTEEAFQKMIRTKDPEDEKAYVALEDEYKIRVEMHKNTLDTSTNS